MATVAPCLSEEHGEKSVRGLWREGKWGCSLRPHRSPPRRMEDTHGTDKTVEAPEEDACVFTRWVGRVCESYLRGASRDGARWIWHLEVLLSVSEQMLCDKQMCLSR